MAEQVFEKIRKVSLKQGYFTWKQFYDSAWKVRERTYPVSTNWIGRDSFKCTVGKMLRAQCKHGTILRTGRGRYLMLEDSPRRPLYVTAGNFRHHGMMTEVFFGGHKQEHYGL